LEDFLMAKKPTYEELKQKVRDLEKNASKDKQEDARNQAEETLRENEERLNTILD
jgi:hypothetical protein